MQHEAGSEQSLGAWDASHSSGLCGIDAPLLDACLRSLRASFPWL